jgi:hypothetical protein
MREVVMKNLISFFAGAAGVDAADVGTMVFAVLVVAVAAIAALGFALETGLFRRSKTGALVLAAKRGDAETVKQLLDEGVDINGRGPYPNLSALHCAAGGGHIHTVQLLLDRGAFVDGGHRYVDQADTSCTPLFLAVINGHAEIADLLLEHGANVTTAGGEIPVLYPAARRGDERLVRVLLARGANSEQHCVGTVNGYNYGYGLQVEHGLCPGLVKQLVKETLDGAVPRVCGNCESVGRGVSRDFFVIRDESVVSTLGLSSKVTFTKGVVLETQSFFVCEGCIEVGCEASTRQRKQAWAEHSLGVLAQAWFKQSRASFEQRHPAPPKYSSIGLPGDSYTGIGLLLAQDFFREAEVSRRRRA